MHGCFGVFDAGVAGVPLLEVRCTAKVGQDLGFEIESLARLIVSTRGVNVTSSGGEIAQSIAHFNGL